MEPTPAKTQDFAKWAPWLLAFLASMLAAWQSRGRDPITIPPIPQSQPLVVIVGTPANVSTQPSTTAK